MGHQRRVRTPTLRRGPKRGTGTLSRVVEGGIAVRTAVHTTTDTNMILKRRRPRTMRPREMQCQTVWGRPSQRRRLRPRPQSRQQQQILQPKRVSGQGPVDSYALDAASQGRGPWMMVQRMHMATQDSGSGSLQAQPTGATRCSANQGEWGASSRAACSRCAQHHINTPLTLIRTRRNCGTPLAPLPHPDLRLKGGGAPPPPCCLYVCKQGNSTNGSTYTFA